MSHLVCYTNHMMKMKNDMNKEIEKLMLHHVNTCTFWVAAQREFIFELNNQFKMHTTPELNEKFCLLWEKVKGEPTTIDGTFRSEKN
jgi:hypothetical protein